MAIDTLHRAALFVVLVLAQVLIFNHTHLLGCATVLLYVYFVITIPRNYPKWAMLLWSFVLGLVVDMFSNTPGMATASLTFVGFVQPYLLESLITREAPENMKSSISALGFTKFLTLTSILVFIHCLLFFTIEAFSFFNWQQWLLNIGGSTVFTVLVLMALESVRK